MASDESKLFAALSHGLGFLVPVIPALVIWLIKKDSDGFAGDHAREALNFQITVFIAYIVSVVLMLVLIGFLLAIVVGIIALVFTIIAIIKAATGEQYQYPFAIRFFK